MSAIAQPDAAPVPEPGRPRRWRRYVLLIAIVPGVLVVALILAFMLSPRPGALLIRWVFEADAENRKEALAAHAPEGVTSLLDQQYRKGDNDAMLDVYFPDSASTPGTILPTLVWTHGGAWVSGHRDDVPAYFQLIAKEGFTVISLGYSVAPGEQYPTPVVQVNDALAYIQENAGALHVDTTRIVMAGDSAGAQITSQVAALTINPAFAAEMGITPSLAASQLRGVGLFCGIYDVDRFLAGASLSGGLLEWGTRTSLWAYTGSKGGDTMAAQQMSTINHVTPDFPTAFISGGNDDPLTEGQSVPLANHLQEIGVDVTTLFYPKDHTPPLGHLYHFNLDNEDGKQALRLFIDFLRKVTT